MQIDRLKYFECDSEVQNRKNSIRLKFIIFEHSFTHLPTIIPFTIMSYGIINARHTFSIIHTKPHSMSRSSPTKNRTMQRPKKKTNKTKTPQNPRCLKTSYDLPGRKPLECEKSVEKRHYYNVLCCSTDLCNNDRTLTVEHSPTRGIFIYIQFPFNTPYFYLYRNSYIYFMQKF